MDLHTVETYLCPTTLNAVPAWGDGWAWLAGGTWLFSEPQPQITALVDLEALGWSEIELTPEGLAIGATCPLVKLQQFPWQPEWTATQGLQQAVSALAASQKVINLATVGGNLCLALPVGTLAPVMVALGAEYELWSRSDSVEPSDPVEPSDSVELDQPLQAAAIARRRVPALAFQTGARQTKLRSGEVLRRVWIPHSSLTWQVEVQRIGIAATDPALSLVVRAYNPTTAAVRFGLGACLPAPRLIEFPQLPTTDQIAEALQPLAADWLDDARASARYRQAITQVLMQRSLLTLSVSSTSL